MALQAAPRTGDGLPHLGNDPRGHAREGQFPDMHAGAITGIHVGLDAETSGFSRRRSHAIGGSGIARPAAVIAVDRAGILRTCRRAHLRSGAFRVRTRTARLSFRAGDDRCRCRGKRQRIVVAAFHARQRSDRNGCFAPTSASSLAGLNRDATGSLGHRRRGVAQLPIGERALAEPQGDSAVGVAQRPERHERRSSAADERRPVTRSTQRARAVRVTSPGYSREPN